MPRIRTIKPEFFRHEGLYECEQKYNIPARLVFAGLFICCDREGRFRWKPNQLKLDIMPFDNVNIELVLDVLAKEGFIMKYQFDASPTRASRVNDACFTEFYGWIPSWSKHQHINGRESNSTYPDPEDCKIISFKNKEIQMEIDTCFTRRDASPTRASRDTDLHVHARGEGKGKEGKGKEEKRKSKQKEKSQIDLFSDNIREVFEYWQFVMHHPKAKLDKRRVDLIRSALELGYSRDDLCLAVDGCKLTPHNMGQNEKGECYDGLHVIFRDAGQIDRFLKNASNPPLQKDRLNENIGVATEWLQTKNGEQQ